MILPQLLPKCICKWIKFLVTTFLLTYRYSRVHVDMSLKRKCRNVGDIAITMRTPHFRTNPFFPDCKLELLILTVAIAVKHQNGQFLSFKKLATGTRFVDLLGDQCTSQQQRIKQKVLKFSLVGENSFIMFMFVFLLFVLYVFLLFFCQSSSVKSDLQ